jgi:signal transduction histidine kinase
MPAGVKWSREGEKTYSREFKMKAVTPSPASTTRRALPHDLLPLSCCKGAYSQMRKYILVISGLLVAFTLMLYMTHLDREREFIYHLDILFQSLYFIPVVLACIWFGLKGGFLTAFAAIAVMIPNMILHWNGFSAMDLERILQKITYFLLALVLGKAIEGQRKEQKRAQETETLAAVGRSIASVSHNLKTPLVSIGGFTRLVKKHLPDNHPQQDKLAAMITEVDRMESMVRDLAAFSRPINLQREKRDVAEMIVDVLTLTEVEAQKRNVKLHSDIPEQALTALVDEQRIKESLINLVVNAIEASPEGKEVFIRTFRRGGSLIIEITDQGCGIAPDQKDEVFRPFLTTKKTGMGLGLPTAKKIIQAHGGDLVIESDSERGTTFRAVIPNAVT